MKIARVLEAKLFSLNFGLPSSVDLGRRRCRTACKYAVKVDVDVATLRPFGQILYRSVHRPLKIGLSAGVGVELLVVPGPWVPGRKCPSESNPNAFQLCM